MNTDVDPQREEKPRLDVRGFSLPVRRGKVTLLPVSGVAFNWKQKINKSEDKFAAFSQRKVLKVPHDSELCPRVQWRGVT